MRLKLVISEPWNFESNTGPNRLEVEVLKNVSGKMYCRCISKFYNMTEFVLLIPRNNYRHYNIYKCKSNDFNEKNLEFAMIGSIK